MKVRARKKDCIVQSLKKSALLAIKGVAVGSGNPALPQFVEVFLIEQAEAGEKSTRWGQVNFLPQAIGRW